MDYVIKADELYRMAKEILNDGMDFVHISFLEGDDSDPDDILPDALKFDASKKGSYGLVDYDSIDLVSID